MVRKKSKRCTESGSIFVEAALSIPFLLLLVFGMMAVGRLFSQVSWLIQTSYEGVMASSQVIEYTGKSETYRIKTMFQDELNRDMQSVGLTHSYSTENDANTGDDVPLVKVALAGDLFPIKMMGTVGLSVDLTGPHIGKGFGMPDNADFQTVNGPYKCDGTVCTEGADCPTNPC
jgi:hypothetical protein